MPLVASFVGVGVDPQVSSATATTGTQVLVTFSEAMTSDAELTDPTNYTITEDLGSDARTVDHVAILSPTEVLLTLDGVLSFGTLNYSVEVADTVTDLAGNTLDSGADSADFSGHAAVPVVADWCTLGTSWLLAQFADQPRMRALLCLLLDQVQVTEQVVADMRDLRALETAYGAQLDEWGIRLGFRRDPSTMSDATYRRYLIGVAMARIAECSPDDMIRVVLQAAGLVAGDIDYTDDYPARVLITSTVPLTYENGHLAAVVARIAKPAGVGFSLQYEPSGAAGPVITFADDTLRTLTGFADDVVHGSGVWAERDSGI